MPFPLIVSLYTALSVLLVLWLAWRVTALRRDLKIGIGDGSDHRMSRAVRVHANAVEYLPLALIQLALLELSGHPAGLLHACGAALLVGRSLHAWGLSKSAGVSFGRAGGTLLTWVTMLVMAVLLLLRALR